MVVKSEKKALRQFNSISSNVDKRQISLCDINAFSVSEVMRIKDSPRLSYKWRVAVRKENLQFDV